MRATYEDLLRAARRAAVSALRGTYPDEAEVLADWDAVLGATRNHLRWLRTSLKTEPGAREPASCSDNSLGRLARTIGAAADILAVQDSVAAAALDVRDDLIAARAEVAAIARIGAEAVLRNTKTRTPGRLHLKTVIAELEEIAGADSRRMGLGGLGVLAAGGPGLTSAGLMIAPLAARWERVHTAVDEASVLTRELRSTTAQLRTVGGQVWHVATHVLSSPHAGLDVGQRRDLQVIRRALRGFDSHSRLVERAWRRRLSDLGGPGNSLDETAFLDLKDSMDELLRDRGGLRSPRDLVGHRRSAVVLIDAIDELLWSAKQVAGHQQRMVSWSIAAGRLFVPRHEAAQVELAYLRRPGGGARLLQPWWVRTDRAGCFGELTRDLTEATDSLRAASDMARRLAGTSRFSRRTADPVVRLSSAYVDLASGIADQGQEVPGPGR
ncbi:hypothetical protein AB0L64_39840 [Kribbella sp. NPDC051936]|uniref:hypothetical protein n=1 Tax=Kribbella sp. NPDC051936 TaxID=3154946 RepID=UPI003412DCFA